jgi:hypothetical protein
MAAARDRLCAEIGEYPMQIAVQRSGEVGPEATAAIASAAESKPVLADFGEAKPMVEPPLAYRGVSVDTSWRNLTYRMMPSCRSLYRCSSLSNSRNGSMNSDAAP